MCNIARLLANLNTFNPFSITLYSQVTYSTGEGGEGISLLILNIFMIENRIYFLLIIFSKSK